MECRAKTSFGKRWLFEARVNSSSSPTWRSGSSRLSRPLAAASECAVLVNRWMAVPEGVAHPVPRPRRASPLQRARRRRRVDHLRWR